MPLGKKQIIPLAERQVASWRERSLTALSRRRRSHPHELGGRDRIVRQDARRDPGAIGDEPLPRHEFLAAIDGIDADDFALLEIESRKAAFLSNIAPHRDLVIAGRYAGDLQLELILIGPEPWDSVINGLAPGDHRCGHACLIISVLNRFKPHSDAIMSAHEARAVPCREDRWIGRAAEVID